MFHERRHSTPVSHETSLDSLIEELAEAGHVLDRAGLVTAFGHVSCRLGPDRVLITPPEPLGGLTGAHAFTELDLTDAELPPGVPREAWIHAAIAKRRPDVGAICRAQPPVATALAAAGVPIEPLHGQAPSSAPGSRYSTTRCWSGTGTAPRHSPTTWATRPPWSCVATGLSPSEPTSARP